LALVGADADAAEQSERTAPRPQQVPGEQAEKPTALASS